MLLDQYHCNLLVSMLLDQYHCNLLLSMLPVSVNLINKVLQSQFKYNSKQVTKKENNKLQYEHFVIVCDLNL